MRQVGHTLLELMLALALGLFMLTASLSFYQSAQNTQKVQKVMATAKENAKFALDLIKADIQMAGFYGCITPMADSRVISTLNTPDAFKWNFLHAVTANGNTDPSLANADLYQGDVLTLRYADRQAFNIAEHPNSTDPLTTTLENNLRRYDYALVSDCVSGSIFQKTNSTTGSLTIQHSTADVPNKYAGNSTDDLETTYSTQATVRRLYSISYYIAKKTGRIPALYRKDGARRAEEVISGIADMRLRFGIDNNADGTVDAYLSAAQLQTENQADNSRKIVLIHLTLTAKAYKENIITGEEVALYNNGAEIQYTLEANIALRNHLP